MNTTTFLGNLLLAFAALLLALGYYNGSTLPGGQLAPYPGLGWAAGVLLALMGVFYATSAFISANSLPPEKRERANTPQLLGNALAVVVAVLLGLAFYYGSNEGLDEKWFPHRPLAFTAIISIVLMGFLFLWGGVISAEQERRASQARQAAETKMT